MMCLLPAPQINVSMVYRRAVCRTGQAGFICCLIILPAVFPASTGFTSKPGRDGSAPPCLDLADVPQEGALGWCERGVPPPFTAVVSQASYSQVLGLNWRAFAERPSGSCTHSRAAGCPCVLLAV